MRTAAYVALVSRARTAFNNWLSRNKHLRPLTCEECGVICTPSAHHTDYTQPLKVQWLCRMCHGRADKALGNRRAA
jgi:hypothetical protein